MRSVHGDVIVGMVVFVLCAENLEEGLRVMARLGGRLLSVCYDPRNFKTTNTSTFSQLLTKRRRRRELPHHDHRMDCREREQHYGCAASARQNDCRSKDH